MHAASIYDAFVQEPDGNGGDSAGDDYSAEFTGSKYVDEDGDSYAIVLKGPGQAFATLTQVPGG